MCTQNVDKTEMAPLPGWPGEALARATMARQEISHYLLLDFRRLNSSIGREKPRNNFLSSSLAAFLLRDVAERSVRRQTTEKIDPIKSPRKVKE